MDGVFAERRLEKVMWVMGREWPWHVKGTVLVVATFYQRGGRLKVEVEGLLPVVKDVSS